MYVPSSQTEREAMLDSLGLKSAQELFSVIPEAVRTNSLDMLPPAKTEPELMSFFQDLAGQNRLSKFLGAGVYDHTVPAAVEALASRSEFVTAYTPYQPEVSQGTLTAIFEFQSMICSLTGLDVSNASLYDAAQAACEAAAMACGQAKDPVLAVSAGLHPDISATLRTYARFAGYRLTELPLATDSGQTVWLDGSYTAAFIQSPNFFGIVEPMTELAGAAKAAGAVPVAICDPLSLGLLKSPAECGFDIAVGECQPLGLRPSFGGPYAGYIAARERFLRRMPGRIVSETTDSAGRRAFVLTLQAREQHIRREKATSNICSNQAHCALTATIWLSLMGAAGLREAALQSAQKAAYLRSLLLSGGIEPLYNGPYFREFAVKGLHKGAYPLPGQNASLIAVTEKRTRAEIEEFAEEVLRNA